MEKRVVATVTKEEAEQFVELNAREKAIKELQKNLIDEQTEVVKIKQKVWDEIQKKYELSGTLSLNSDTREVTEL
jgi:predicted transcriptional regulator